MKKNAHELIFNEQLDQDMKNADFENALTVDEVPILKARQAAKKADIDIFDADVWQLIQQHKSNKKDMVRMNNILRSLFA